MFVLISHIRSGGRAGRSGGRAAADGDKSRGERKDNRGAVATNCCPPTKRGRDRPTPREAAHDLGHAGGPGLGPPLVDPPSLAAIPPLSRLGGSRQLGAQAVVAPSL